MNSRRRISTLLSAVATAAAVLAGIPATAAPGLVTCEIAATVRLDTVENLLAVDGGSGTLSGNFICEGTVSGFAVDLDGAFRFCGHRGTTHTSQCVAPADQADMEPLADNVPSQAPIISHVQSDLITIRLNTGVVCTHGLNGHTVLTQAHLVMTNFTCKQGTTTLFGPVNGAAEAASQIIINPTLNCAPHPQTGVKACFQELTFVGQLVAYSTT